MVDISSQNNKINVTVSSSGNTANTNVTPDYAQYYSEKSKEWAISNRIVDNTDYSSKYYANESKKQADISTAKATEVIESGNTAVSNIESARDNAIIDVNTAGATQVALATEQAIIATNKTSEVVASGNTALSNITTAKNNAITSITTQETTSKNNVITTGNEQVKRVNLTGVDNRTPIFTKSEVGTNKSVYKNVYDLKYSSGNKTGIDTIKADNYEVVGSPVISDDGVVSGFSIANYIKSNSDIAFTAGQTWEIDLKVNIKNSESGIDKVQCLFQIYASNPSLNSLQAILYNNCVFWTCPTTPSGGATNRFLQFTSEFNISSYLNQDIWFKFIYNGTQYIFEWSADGINYTREVASTDSRQFTGTGTLNLGAMSIHQQGLQGSIDLNDTKVYINDNLAYQPCLKIPYTQSKTGSKIVDVAYRDRVIDLYEQEGQAGYYTIDEPNKNFTLPMGEIYGMIESKADKDMLNNPFTFGMSQYYKGEMKNLSWLKSNGQEYFKNGHPDFYNWVLTNANAGKEGFKLSTASDITDYDFVVNPTKETFRLPLKNGMEGVFANTTAPVVVNSSSFGKGTETVYTKVLDGNTGEVHSGSTVNVFTVNGRLAYNGYSYESILLDPNGTLQTDLSSITVPQGYNLYYYVGETVEGANLIKAGEVWEEISNKQDKCIHIVDTYVNGTSWYRVYSDGFKEQGGQFSTSWASYTVTFPVAFTTQAYSFCSNGDCTEVEKKLDSFKATYAFGNGQGYNIITWYACGY